MDGVAAAPHYRPPARVLIGATGLNPAIESSLNVPEWQGILCLQGPTPMQGAADAGFTRLLMSLSLLLHRRDEPRRLQRQH